MEENSTGIFKLIQKHSAIQFTRPLTQLHFCKTTGKPGTPYATKSCCQFMPSCHFFY